MARLLLAMAAGLSILSGCASPRFEQHPRADTTQTPRTSLSSPIRLISDTQFHESRGEPSRYASLAGDEFIPVTIRTGQQVIGTGDILLESVFRTDAYPLTLHLGDAIDVSCQTEWKLFTHVMKKGLGAPGASSWLFTPGNHDGFYVGNFLPQKGDKYAPSYWSNVCNVGRLSNQDGVIHDRVSKRHIVKHYLQLLFNDESEASLKREGVKCVADKQLCVHYHLPDNEWESFIVQLVRLPGTAGALPIYGLLLDTSDYDTRPYVHAFAIRAGEQGGVSERQLEAARALIGSTLEDGARFFILGHHPLDDWRTGKWTGKKLATFASVMGHRKSLQFVVTAHTHEGGWAEHVFGELKVTELNIGSLIDPPVYFRTLQFERDDHGHIYANSERALLTDTIAVDCSAFPLPEKGAGHAVDDQRSESDRLSKAPFLVRQTAAFKAAVGHFFAFFRAKHSELGPQLLSYADVVEASMPPDEKFIYHPKGASGGPYTFPDRTALVRELRDVGRCDNKENECHASRKQHLLYELDQYYWHRADEATQQAGHRARYCYALHTAEASGRGTRVVEDVLKRSVSIKRRLHAN